MRDEASEGYDELVFEKKKRFFFLFGLRVSVINTKDSLYHQAEVVADHALHIEEIAFGNLTWFPERLAFGDILIGQRLQSFAKCWAIISFLSVMTGRLHGLEKALLSFQIKR